MNSGIELKLGDPVEVTYSVRAIGYLFKAGDEELILCSSERNDRDDQLTLIPNRSVMAISCLSRPVAQAAKPKESKIIPFTPRSLEDPA